MKKIFGNILLIYCVCSFFLHFCSTACSFCV